MTAHLDQAASVERASILPKDDPAAVEVVRRSLIAEGLELREGVEVRRVERRGNGIAVTIAPEGGGPATVVEGSHLLVAAGRQANVEGLDLEKVGIDYDLRVVRTDRSLRTTNRKVWAVGDVAGRGQLTHLAAHHASVVIKQALFRLPAKVDDNAVPWVTFTDPEVASRVVCSSELQVAEGWCV